MSKRDLSLHVMCIRGCLWKKMSFRLQQMIRTIKLMDKVYTF